MTTITSTTNSSTQLQTVVSTPASTKKAATAAGENTVDRVRISERGRQASASTADKVANATANLEKQATKLAERAASTDLSDSERKKINGSLQAINGAIKGLGGNQAGSATSASADSAKGPVAKATANLEKAATKLAEQAGAKDLSDSERKKLNGALQSVNGALKELGGKEVGTTPASDNGSAASKTAPPVKSAALATATENMLRKNESSRAALNTLEKAYGGGTGTTSNRLSFLA